MDPGSDLSGVDQAPARHERDCSEQSVECEGLLSVLFRSFVKCVQSEVKSAVSHPDLDILSSSLKDKDGNTPLHHVMDFIGCIHVRSTSVRICQGCYFPQKASDTVGSVYYKKFGGDGEVSVYIRLKRLEEVSWMFESDDSFDRFTDRYFSSVEVREDELPWNKPGSWKPFGRSQDGLDTLDDWKWNTDKAPLVAGLLIGGRANITCQNRRGRTPLCEP